jgi:HEPN domain-containing protein
MKNIIKKWIIIADKDLQAAEILINNSSLTSNVAFNCQQAIEKYFKAYLLEHNWKLRKTHDLIELYIQIGKIKDLQINFQTLIEINRIYPDIRYPDNYVEPTKEDIEIYFDFAKEVKRKIEKELGITL